MGALIALCHHERYDGQGYPRGLAGQDIPLPARIVTVADVFDALTTVRAYKRAWPLDAALTYMRDQAGDHFDPECVGAFLRRTDEIRRILRDYQDSGSPRA
jgi:two-component system response regulator RpfG